MAGADGTDGIRARRTIRHWYRPVSERVVCTRLTTPYGPMELVRTPGPRSARASGDDWALLRGDQRLLELVAVNAKALRGDFTLDRKLLEGAVTDGSAALTPLQLEAPRGLLPRRRDVWFTVGDTRKPGAFAVYRFRCGAFGSIVAELGVRPERPQFLGRRRSGRWRLDRTDPATVAYVAAFEALGVRRWMGRPVLFSWTLSAALRIIAWTVVVAVNLLAN